MRGSSAIYFKSLNRHFTILGVDRQVFFLLVGLCLPIAFSGHLAPSMDGIAFGIFMVLYIAGVLITRTDPQIVSIYRRHIHYKKYYKNIAGIHAPVLRVKESVAFYQGKRGLV